MLILYLDDIISFFIFLMCHKKKELDAYEVLGWYQCALIAIG